MALSSFEFFVFCDPVHTKGVLRHYYATTPIIELKRNTAVVHSTGSPYGTRRRAACEQIIRWIAVVTPISLHTMQTWCVCENTTKTPQIYRATVSQRGGRKQRTAGRLPCAIIPATSGIIPRYGSFLCATRSHTIDCCTLYMPTQTPSSPIITNHHTKIHDPWREYYIGKSSLRIANAAFRRSFCPFTTCKARTLAAQPHSRTRTSTAALAGSLYTIELVVQKHTDLRVRVALDI